MNNLNLKVIKTKKIGFSILGKILRKLSVIVAYYLDKLGFYPNQVTVFRIFFFGGISLFLLYSSNYYLNLIGLVTIFLCYFFDLVDGDLARNHDKKTKLGHFLDINFDSIILNLIILTLTIKLINFNYESIYIYGGAIALFGTIMSSKMTTLFQDNFGINCVEGNLIIEKFLEKNKFDKLSTFIYGLITPKSFLMSLFSNFRYFLLFGIIFGEIHICLLIFAILLNIRWIILFLVVVGYYRNIEEKENRLSIYLLMNKLVK